MNIIRQNMISLLSYATKKRKEQEHAEYGPDFKSAELAAWEEYLEYVESGPDGFFTLID